MIRSPRRIQHLLYGMLTAPFTLITAPPGYEKLATVQTFLQKRSGVHPFCFTFQSRERESEAWDRFRRELGARCLLPEQLPETGVELDLLCQSIRAAVNGISVVVLNHCDSLPPGRLDWVLREIAGAKIRGFHLVAIAWKRPRFVTDELAYSRDCLWIGREDLTLTREETEKYFRGKDLELTGSVWNTLRGWPGLVRMCIRAGGEQTADCREFLNRELLAAYPPAFREVVELLSRQKRFSDPGLPVLSGNKAVRILAELESDGLVENRSGEWLLHPLLQEPVEKQQPLLPPLKRKRTARIPSRPTTSL